MNIKTLPPNLPFWEFKDTLVKLEECLNDKEYYQIKYVHYINYQKEVRKIRNKFLTLFILMC